MSNLNKNRNDNNSLDFKKALNFLADIFIENDIYVQPFNDNSMSKYNQLSVKKKREIHGRLQTYIQACLSANNEGIKLKETRNLLKHHLKLLGMKAPDTLFDKIDDGDIVEAYNLNQIQIFRSIIFLELCHYTIADVLLNEWYNLYERDGWVNKKIIEYIDLTSNENNELVKCHIPVHEMTEIFSKPRGVFSCEYKYFAPLFSGPENRCGFICAIKAKPIAQIKKLKANLKLVSSTLTI